MKTFFFIAWRAMGCEITVQLETEADGEALLKVLPAEVEAIEARLSRFRPDSELMQFNARAGQWVKVSPMLFDNLRAAKHAARLTEGRFNPLVLPALLANGYDRSFADIVGPEDRPPIPAADWREIEFRSRTDARIPAGSALDLGGIAKGWTAAKLADDLKPYGACLVNFGGDLVARGAREWEVGLDDPSIRLSLRDASLVTSGIDFRRWTTATGAPQHHIVDPRTGRSAGTDILTVSIHHPHAPTAEAYSKAVLLRGAENGLKWLQTQWNAAGLVVRHDGAVLMTPQFTDLIQKRNLL